MFLKLHAGTIHKSNPKQLVVFVMAQIQRIVHNHQALFLDIIVGNQAVTLGENKLPHAQYNTDSEPPN